MQIGYLCQVVKVFCQDYGNFVRFCTNNRRPVCAERNIARVRAGPFPFMALISGSRSRAAQQVHFLYSESSPSRAPQSRRAAGERANFTSKLPRRHERLECKADFSTEARACIQHVRVRAKNPTQQSSRAVGEESACKPGSV